MHLSLLSPCLISKPGHSVTDCQNSCSGVLEPSQVIVGMSLGPKPKLIKHDPFDSLMWLQLVINGYAWWLMGGRGRLR